MTRDINKILKEYDSKYDKSCTVWSSEIINLHDQSEDIYELMMNCIKFGYVIGRRAEKNHRNNRLTNNH